MFRLLAAIAPAMILLAASALLAKPLREGRSSAPSFISLLTKANVKLTDSLGNFAGNNLADLPVGEKVYAQITFKVEEKLILLNGTNLRKERPTKVEGIKVDRRFTRLHILHATGYGSEGTDGDVNFAADGTLIGEYKINYIDKTTAVIPIEYGKDVVAWTGNNELGRERQRQGAKFGNKLRLYVTTWTNANPDKLVTTIDFHSMNTICCPFCVAMTAQ